MIHMINLKYYKENAIQKMNYLIVLEQQGKLILLFLKETTFQWLKIFLVRQLSLLRTQFKLIKVRVQIISGITPTTPIFSQHDLPQANGDLQLKNL
jgi:hypothetical protein